MNFKRIIVLSVLFLIYIGFTVYLFRFYEAIDNAVEGARLWVDEQMYYERYIALFLAGVSFGMSLHLIQRIVKEVFVIKVKST